MSLDDAQSPAVAPDVAAAHVAPAPSPRPWTAHYAPGVRATIPACTESLLGPLERSARKYGDAVALDFLGATMTYSQLLNEVTRAAKVLHEAGVGHGTRVALAMPSCPQHVVAFYAVLRVGGIVVEHSPLYGPTQYADQLNDSGSEVVIAWDKIVPLIESVRATTGVRTVFSVDMVSALPDLDVLAAQLTEPKALGLQEALQGAPVDGVLGWDALVAAAEPLSVLVPGPQADDVAALQYTGGTTGTPKGAILTHRNLGVNTAQADEWFSQLEEGKEVIYAVLPLFHVFGLVLCLTYSMRKAARLVLFPKFDVGLVLATMPRVPATFFGAVPPMFEAIAVGAQRAGVSLTSIRSAVSAGMAMPTPTAELWEEVTGGLLIQAYGMTETSPFALSNPPNENRRHGSLGFPVSSTDVRIVDTEDSSALVPEGERGELLIQGPQVFGGYWNRPEETAATLLDDGWLRTGDVVVRAEDGSVQLVDRIKELIIIGGFNVYPSQVEDHLRLMPQVQDAAVVGVPGGKLGERVVAAIVLAQGAQLDLAAIREWCAEHVNAYAVPRQLVILQDLPRSQVGKVLRRVVREQVLALRGKLA